MPIKVTLAVPCLAWAESINVGLRGNQSAGITDLVR